MDEDVKLKFECPYTWDISTFIEFSKQWYEMQELTNEGEIFLVQLIKHIIMLCEGVIKIDFEQIEDCWEKLELLRKDINEENLENGQISVKVVNHILDSTIYFTLKKLMRYKEASKIRERIKELELTNDLEVSTLSGCKSIAWSTYYEEGAEKAVFYANQAKKHNAHCGLWYYIAALNIRRMRRTDGYHIPSFIEKHNFRKAYEISQNHFFGISLALCYKEYKEHNKSLKLYQEIKERDINNLTVYCKLALGFIYYNAFEKAEQCLKKAEQHNPKAAILLHYKGLLLEKLHKYDEAEVCFKESGKQGNFRADMNYAKCHYKNHPEENIIDFLKQLFMRYDSEKNQMQLWLHIGMHYYQEYDDIEHALLSFKKAIMIDPESGMLKEYFYFINSQKYNIYHFLLHKLFVKARDIFDDLSSNGQEAFDVLSSYANIYYQKFKTQNTVKELSNLHI